MYLCSIMMLPLDPVSRPFSSSYATPFLAHPFLCLAPSVSLSVYLVVYVFVYVLCVYVCVCVCVHACMHVCACV